MNYSLPIAKIVKSVIFATALAVPMSLITAKSALAQNLVFTLYNKTESNLVTFQVSPTGVDDWEEDILDVDILASGQSTNININDGRTVCTYDIRGVFDDGEESTKYKVNLCELGSFTFYED